jgi:bifunctional non-homologous end joining protein LigD
MKVMKPIRTEKLPSGNMWKYEVKYDGFRCILHWEKNNVRLFSKREKDFTSNFPEIVEACLKNQKDMEPYLPIRLDGELVVLNNAFQANFSQLQKRGRLKNKATIANAAATRPASFMAFDLLEWQGRSLIREKLADRKKQLEELFRIWPEQGEVRPVKTFENKDTLTEIVFTYKGEGIVAKRQDTSYLPGKNHQAWIKVKNWRTLQGILTAYDTENQYFTVQVFDKDGTSLVDIGKCKHGINQEELQTVRNLFTGQGEKQHNVYTLPPAICASIRTLDLYEGEFREPEIHQLLPGVSPESCNTENMKLGLAMLPPKVEYTNTEKVFWPADGYTKGDLLVYIREISPYMLPYLKNRALTVIRAPDGVDNEYFYQKHLPDYAPAFMEFAESADGKLMLADNLDAVMWLANHGTVEFHIPFQTINSSHPTEIVFDLDPPDRSKFHLAVRASLIIRELLDDLALDSFVKLSGNKGLQVHIPIPQGSMDYEETGLFTKAIAYTVEAAEPELFTTERMKTKRHGRLYIDYVQHGKDKTLIAPYSPRKTKEATVAAPLFWQEVGDELRPEPFTIKHVIDRVHIFGCPFANYMSAGEKQDITRLKKLIQG